MSFRDSQSIHYYHCPPASHSTNTSDSTKRGLLSRKAKNDRTEDNGAESPQAPDSTTEPPKPAHDFQEGDDVFFLNEEGVNILGTIGTVTPTRCQIFFGDGTQQWAPYKKVKKLSCSFDEPASTSFEDSPIRESLPTRGSIKTDLVCIVCKGKKKISSKKAATYNSTSPFTCARCTAAKVVPKPTLNRVNNTGPVPSYQQRTQPLPLKLIRRTSTSSAAVGPNSTSNFSHSSNNKSLLGTKLGGPSQPLITSLPPQQQQPPTLTGINNSNATAIRFSNTTVSKISSPSSTTTGHLGSSTSIQGIVRNAGGGMIIKPIRTSVPVQLKTSPNKNGSKSNLCFHCGDHTIPQDRVHCQLCERYCHHLCLQTSPPPMQGDKFWDVLCVACGTNKTLTGNESETNRVFSVRRSINSWSDVVQLIINCLEAKCVGQEYFHFDTQIIPFLDANIDKLHLPRVYKLASKEERKKKLLEALTRSRLRFRERKIPEKQLQTPEKTCSSLWALRSENSPSDTSSPDTPPSSTANTNKNVSLRTSQGQPSRTLLGSTRTTTSSSVSVCSTTNKHTIHSLHRTTSSTDTSPETANNSVKISTSNSSLPLSIKNRIASSPSSSLSIFPIPNYTSTSNSSATANIPTSPSTGGYPRVLTKEMILKSPMTTNILLSPTTSSPIVTTAGLPKKSVTVTSTSTPSSQTEMNARLGHKGSTTYHKDGSDPKTPDKNESSSNRQRLRIRIPLKPAGAGEKTQPISSSSPTTRPSSAATDIVTPKKKSLPSSSSSTSSSFINSSAAKGQEQQSQQESKKQPTTSTAARVRKRLLSSEEDAEDKSDDSETQEQAPPPAKIPKLTLSTKIPHLTKQSLSIKSPEPISSMTAAGALRNPAVSPNRLGSPVRGRPKSLRSATLNTNNKKTNSKVVLKGKAAVAIQRGRGRPSKLLNSIAPKDSSSSSQNSNDSFSNRPSTATSNGAGKPEGSNARTSSNGALPVSYINNGGNSNGSHALSNGSGQSVNGLKIRKVPYVPPPPPMPPPKGADVDSDTEDLDPLKTFRKNMYNAVIHNGIQIKCLPSSSTSTPSDMETTKRSIAQIYQQEDDCEGVLLSQNPIGINGHNNHNSNSNNSSEDSNNSQNGFPPPKKHKKNRFNKTLDDLDSYEVAGSRVGPDGVVQYMLVWKEPVSDCEQPDFDDEIARLFTQPVRPPPSYFSSLFQCKPEPVNDHSSFQYASISKDSKKLSSSSHFSVLKKDNDIEILTTSHSSLCSTSSNKTFTLSSNSLTSTITSNCSSSNNQPNSVACVVDLTSDSP